MTARTRPSRSARQTGSRLKREVGSELDIDLRSVFQSARNSLREIFPHGEASLSLWQSGRAAISAALRAILTVAPRPWRFLLPSYLCPAVLQPLQNLGVAYDFYPVTDRLSTDWDDVRRSTHSQHYTGLLFIPYFGATGYGAPLDDLFPDRENSFVIEDLAQAMLSPRAGHRGDYVIYSPRKFFGLPDGGALIAKNNAPAPSPPTPGDGFFGLRLLAFRLRELFRCENLRDRKTHLSAFKAANQYLDACTTAPAMSDCSVQLLERDDLQAARRRRCENFAFLREHWPRHKRVIPLELPWHPSDVPLGFPVWAAKRDAFKSALIQRGIFPPVHWNLPEAVRTDTRFRASRELSEHILTIPCDQRYGTKEMNVVIRAVREIVR